METRAAPNLIRWGPVFAGALIAFATMTVLTSFWLALGQGSGIDAFRGSSLNWWIGASAIVSMFVGGGLAGWVSGIRGLGAGLLHGLTVWGLVLFGSLVVALPGLTLVQTDGGVLWTVFWSLIIGAGSASFGGIIGGAMPHEVFADAPPPSFRRRPFKSRRQAEDGDSDRDSERDRQPITS